VEGTVKRWQADGLAASTIKTRLVNLRTILRAAVLDKVIPTDPSARVSPPRGRRAAVAMSIPTPQQVGALLAAADPSIRAAIALAAGAGLRLGEVCGLQRDDVVFLGRVLRIRRQVQRGGACGEVEIREPKGGSERDIPLPDELLAILSAHVATHAGPVWMFPAEGGGPHHQDSLGHFWEQARKRAGLCEVRFHDLRHYYASGLISQGCDVVTVQRAMGHSSPAITLNTYSHLWPDAADRTRAAAAELLAAALRTGPDSADRGADRLRTADPR
jgi:integrase